MSNDKKIAEAITQDLLTDKFIQEVGQKARVERSSLENSEHMDNLRAVIADVGQNLLDTQVAPTGMTYRGSFSVHVYSASTIRAAAFVTLNNVGTLDGGMADGALRELNNNVKLHFGKRAQRLRSGF